MKAMKHSARFAQSWRAYLPVLLAGLVLLAANLGMAQEEDIAQYVGAYTIGASVVATLQWSIFYFGLYALGLYGSIIMQGRWAGFDATLLGWLVGLWLGGIAISGVVFYRIYPPFHPGTVNWPALLLSMLLLFGWSLLLGTRAWADLSLQEAAITSLVIMLLCAPYLGPTVRVVQPNQKVSIRALSPNTLIDRCAPRLRWCSASPSIRNMLYWL